MSRNRLWIVTPIYFDVGPYLLLRAQILDELTHVGAFDVRFLVVDDSAGEDTRIEEVRCLADTRVVTVPYNVGHQRALVFALRSLVHELEDADVIVTMDADGQDQPQDIPRLLAPIVAPDPRRMASVAVAWRTTRPESVSFKLAYLLFRSLFRIATGTVIRNGNFAAYRAEVGKRILEHPNFDLCYSSTLLSLGVPIERVPCARAERLEGDSKMNTRRLVVHGFRMLMPFLDHMVARALLTCVATAVVATGLGLGVVGLRLFSDVAIPRWGTYTLLAAAALCLTAMTNFLILFAVFSQSRSVTLGNLEREALGPTRAAFGSPDREW